MTSLLRDHSEIATRQAQGYGTDTLAPVHPGEVLLKEFLQPAGLSRGALARALLVHPNRVSALCQGRWFVWERVLWKGYIRTPFCRVRRRYNNKGVMA
jgi:hypothetical protein